MLFLKFWRLVFDFFRSFGRNNLGILASSLAYNAIFAVTPLIYSIIYIFNRFYDGEGLSNETYNTITEIAGQNVSVTVQGLTRSIENQQTNDIVGIISLVLVLLLITNMIHVLKVSLNIIWETRVTHKNPFDVLYQWFVNVFGAGIIGISWILLFFASGILYYIVEFLGYNYYIEVINIIGFWLVSSLLTATLLQLLVRVKIHTKPLLFGSILSGGLIVLGRYAVLTLLRESVVSNLYSSASTVFVFLLWLYYSMLIILIGCQITKLLDSYYKKSVDQENSLQ